MARLLHPLAGALAFASLLAASGELSNRPAPDFRLPDSKGRVVALSDFKGKPLIVEFLSTTCPIARRLLRFSTLSTPSSRAAWEW